MNRRKKGKKLRKREIYLKYRKKCGNMYGWNSQKLKPEKGGGQRRGFNRVPPRKRQSVGLDLLRAEPASLAVVWSRGVWEADHRQRATPHGGNQNVCEASVYNLGRLCVVNLVRIWLSIFQKKQFIWPGW